MLAVEKTVFTEIINKGCVQILKKITPAQIAIGLVCLIMAFGVTLQIKSVKYNKAVTNTDYTRAADLQALLWQERDKNDDLVKQVMQYKDDLQEIKTQELKSGNLSEVLATQLKRSELLAGLTEVEGTGIIVTLHDSRKKSDINLDPNLNIIHDSDILSIINELRASGAEAISLNGDRIVATSEVRCAGPTVSVNNNRYAEPFEIKAIGDSANMENALLMRDGVYDTLTAYSIEVNIKKAAKVTIGSFKGTMNYKYATDVKKEGQ